MYLKIYTSKCRSQPTFVPLVILKQAPTLKLKGSYEYILSYTNTHDICFYQ